MNVRNIPLITGIVIMLFVHQNGAAQKNEALFDPDSPVKKLAGNFSFTEGPAVDQEGNVYFTDQPNNRIWIWTVEGKLALFTNQSGRSNGLYFDAQERLLACADMDNELWRYDHDTVPEILISDYNGKALNGPNDLWVRSDGGLYFSDPMYPRDYWNRDPVMQQPGQYLYYYEPANNDPPVPVDLDFVRPNGIIGNPRKKILYVADIGDKKVYSYKMKKNGQLEHRKLFAAMGSDGMTIDEHGNVYLCGEGVTIFNPVGKKIGHIPVPESWSANACFGGENLDTLFITASTGLYALKMKVKGMRRF